MNFRVQAHANSHRITMLHTDKTSFPALVDKNRRAGRLEPKTEKSSMVLMGMRLPADLADQAKALAAQDGRSVSNFVQRIYMRGLDGYLAERGAAQAVAGSEG